MLALGITRFLKQNEFRTGKKKKELLELRKKIFITGYKGGMAHLASCYSSLEMIYAMYLKGILKYDTSNPKWQDRDRFILSKRSCGSCPLWRNGKSRSDIRGDL